MKNLFSDIPDYLRTELAQTILSTPDVRIERIVSKGHTSPDSFWYDQQENEWVIVLKGCAKLIFENGDEETLHPGDYINLPAHTRHKVGWTEPETETIWLAIWY